MAPKDRIFPDRGDVSSSPPPPAGAYYSVKDQPLPPPATYRGRRRGRNPCCCLLLWLCSILTMLVVALGIAVLVFWLVVRPTAPKYHVDNVQITGLSATSNSSVNASFQINARNPNKHVGFYYDDINLNVETQGVNIGSTTIPDFYQGHKNTTIINAKLSVNGGTLTNSISTNAVDSTHVPLYVKVDLKTRFKVGSWKSGKIKVKVRCNLVVDVTRTSGSQLVSNSCKIKR